jgi:aconitate hydratase
LANLINFGIVPLLFTADVDYDKINSGDELVIENVRQALSGNLITIKNITQRYEFTAKCGLTSRQQAIVLSGGLLNHTKSLNHAGK